MAEDLELIRARAIAKARAARARESNNAPSKKDSKRNKATSFVEGVGETLTLGYAPQIKAGISKAASIIPGVTGQEALTFLDAPIDKAFSSETYEGLPEEEMSYTELRDMARRESDQIQGQNPGSALAGNIVGGFIGPIKGAAGGATLAGKLARGGASGAAISAAYNPGDVEGVVDPVQLGERGKQAVVGGAAGLLTGGLAAAAPKVLSGAQSLAGRALGKGTKGLKKSLGERGMKELGEEALERGIVSKTPRTAKMVDKKVKSELNKVGKQLGEIIDESDVRRKNIKRHGLQSRY